MKHNEHKDKWAHRNKFSAESQIEIADTYILVLEIERKWLDERVSQLESENAELKTRESRHMNQRDRLRERIWQLIRIGYEERAKRYLAESKSAMLEGGEG